MYTSTQNSREQVKQELRQRIAATLQTAKELSPEACFNQVKHDLLALQKYCQMVGKVFIVVEEKITCDCYELGGHHEHAATLFRGPDENASVAICVTERGSLVYRNSTPWIIYRNQGDINPTYLMNTDVRSVSASESMSSMSSSMRNSTKMGV
jgi:hypothetical protein